MRLLSLLTFTFSLDLFINYCVFSGITHHYPRLVFIEVLVAFLYGPLLYLYVVALTRISLSSTSRTSWLHFLPFAMAALLLLPVVQLDDEALRVILKGEVRFEPYISKWARVVELTNLLPRFLIGLYLALGFREIARHRRVIRDHYSEIESISLAWLRNLLAGFTALYLIYVFALAVSDTGRLERILNVSMAALVYGLGYMGLRQPAIFTLQTDNPQQDPMGQEATDDFKGLVERRKYEGSALDGNAARVLLNDLETLMLAERPYLEPDLTLSSLAARLGLPANYLSQVINQQAGRNFYDYVNTYRVQAAKDALGDPARRHASVLSIAMDAGFNSKSAFYSTFKAHTGVTPTQFRQAATS